ncbi:MAG TPA: ATP-binding cassette domain-containing protein, partial [Thermodesulfobacteriota bacterium]|nr:ATP-binding cassette domain-containing protein [Thermodesulfobacteriota bacterium]
MENNVVIKADHLTKSYRLFASPSDRVKETFHPLRKKYHHSFNALTDVSFEVSKGETLGVIGRNGSGKSTLLQVICGVLTPSSGSIETRGRISALLELGAGFNPEFTGRENIYLNASILGFDRGQIEEKLSEILEFAEIGEFIDQPV